MLVPMARAFSCSFVEVTPNTPKRGYTKLSCAFFVRICKVLFKVQRSSLKSR